MHSLRTFGAQSTPLKHTTKDHFHPFLNILCLSPPTVGLVLDKFALSPFLSKLSFQGLSFLITSSSQLAVTVKSSAYSNPQSKPTQNSLQIASLTVIKHTMQYGLNENINLLTVNFVREQW